MGEAEPSKGRGVINYLRRQTVVRGNDRLEVLYYEEGVINWKFYNMNEEWIGLAGEV